MDVKEFERIKGLIKKAELESAKAQGAVDSIKKGWMEEFGTDDVNKIRERLKKMREERDLMKERLDNLYSKLESSCDWDALERELHV
nr:MAG TPA: hypothetical protein [Caudoviricetes sp.]